MFWHILYPSNLLYYSNFSCSHPYLLDTDLLCFLYQILFPRTPSLSNVILVPLSSCYNFFVSILSINLFLFILLQAIYQHCHFQLSWIPKYLHNCLFDIYFSNFSFSLVILAAFSKKMFSQLLIMPYKV